MTVALNSRREQAPAEQGRIQPGHEPGEPHQLAVPPEAHEGEAFQTAVIECRECRVFRDSITATATSSPTNTAWCI